jgi:hypothetical protein
MATGMSSLIIRVALERMVMPRDWQLFLRKSIFGWLQA